MRLGNLAAVIPWMLAFLVPLSPACGDGLKIEGLNEDPPAPPPRAQGPASVPLSQPGRDKPMPLEVHKLLAQLGRPNLSAEDRQKLVSQVLSHGPAAAKALLARCEAERKDKLRAYWILFYQEAQKVGRSKLIKADKAQAKQWQDQVNSPRREKKVTKEVLSEQAGPAMEKLMEALVVQRQEVLDVESVAQRRRELEALEETITRCREAAGLAENPLSTTTGSDEGGEEESPEKAERPTPQREDPLEQTEEILARMGTAMKAADRRAMDANYEARRILSNEEFAGLLHLNVMRAILELNVMRIDPKLCLASRDHSKDMVEKSFFSHSSPVAGKASPWDRARRAGTSASGECIAAGSGSGAGAIRMWFFSPGHHVIILSGSGRVGLGANGATWTLMTGG